MSNKRSRRVLLIGLAVATLLAGTTQVQAQLGGHNTKGDFGLLAGSQAPPGMYVVAPLYMRYEADTLRNRDEDRVRLDFSLDVNAYVFGFLYVSERKFLGGNYSFQIFPGFTDNALAAPLLDLDDSVSTGFTDLYIVPLHLGWHKPRADFVTGLGIFAPTGRFKPGADDNLGLGMWSFELFGGTTLYLNEAKSWHFATNAFYEIHTEKEDTDVQVGDLGYAEVSQALTRRFDSGGDRLFPGFRAAADQLDYFVGAHLIPLLWIDEKRHSCLSVSGHYSLYAKWIEANGNLRADGAAVTMPALRAILLVGYGL